MKAFRTVLFWSHLVVGIATGLIVLIMSMTGVLLTYQKQMTYWADTKDFRTSGGPALSPEALIAKLAESPGSSLPLSITLRSEPGAPASVSLPNAKGPGERTVYVDATTGMTLGEGSKSMREFMSSVTSWHRWLGADAKSRPFWRTVTGMANLGFLFIVASGLFLWFPRVWNRAQFRNVSWFRRGLSSKARDFNWHNTIGIWCFLPLFLVVLSATVISFPWASNLVFKLAGEQPPGAPARPPVAPTGGSPKDSDPSTTGLNALIDVAKQHQPAWRTMTVRIPKASDTNASFTIDSGMGGEPQKRMTLVLDRKTQQVARSETFADGSLGRRMRTFLRFAHTGEFGGVIGQTLAGIVSLGACFLVYTGLALSWRRFFTGKKPAVRHVNSTATL